MTSASWKHRHALPLSLVDLTLQQARYIQSGSAKTGLRDRASFVFLRRAHAHALASRVPDVRGGYLGPSSASEEAIDYGIERRRRTTGIAKDVRRPETDVPHAPSYAALLLNERVEYLVQRTGGELYALEEKEEDLVGVGALHYTETELRDLYTDLLAHPQFELEAQSHFRSRTKAGQKEREEKELRAKEERKDLLETVMKRLAVETDPESKGREEIKVDDEKQSLTAKLAARRRTEASNSEDDLICSLRESLSTDKLHHSILLRVADVVRRVEETRKIIGSMSDTQTAMVSVLSEPEWAVLIRSCVDEDEVDIAEKGLLLMKRCGKEPDDGVVSDVLNVHGCRGDVPAVMSFFEKFAISKPTERQRDIHVKAHLKSPSSSYGIPSALAVLHNYETLALLPAVKTYTRLIVELFRQRSAQCQAQAWDLFSHMRYIAHAKPDAALYTMMIRACAGTGYSQSGYSSDPLRALDLWTEMRTEAGHGPTVGAYNAVILACARSREFVGEAFRLAREMLDGHRDAYGYPLMHPNQDTFDALLVAAKTRKDLSRARWILAEMLKIYEEGVREGVEMEVQPDEKTVMHVFHAYASYSPPFRRGDTRIVDEKDLKTDDEGWEQLSSPGTKIEKSFPRARFSVTPPQTRQEVLAEADTLFERVLSESGLDASGPAFGQDQTDSESDPGPFSRVRLTPFLLNSFLSVHYRHDSLENSRKLFDEVFQRTGVGKTPRTYVEALDVCAYAKKEDRPFARSFAEHIWKEWVEVEKGLNTRSTDSRMIERAHAAMIRMYALIDDLDSALSFLRDFTTRYPPDVIAQPSALKPDMRSTRTLLYAQRPLVHLTTSSEVPDDTVPPILTPQDLELLHHRLVAAGPERQADIDRLTYLMNAYMGALRKRRDRTIRA